MSERSIIERLRESAAVKRSGGYDPDAEQDEEAAAEIERRDRQLKEATDHEVEHMREIERLRAALQRIARPGDFTLPAEIARDALTSTPVETSGSQAARDVLAERQRQISREGWTPEHDDGHEDGALASAAACYAHRAQFEMRPKNAGRRLPELDSDDFITSLWPWSEDWWKPKNPRRDLMRAAALILAEIERLDRRAEETSEQWRCDAYKPCDSADSTQCTNGRGGFPCRCSCHERDELKKFPVNSYRSYAGCPQFVRWGVLSEEWARRNHSQTLGELAQRGGLDPSEIVANIENRPWRAMRPEDAVHQIKPFACTTENGSGSTP